MQLESSVRETTELNETLSRDGDLIGESRGVHSEQLPTSLASSSRYLSRVKDAARRERRGLFASMTFFSAVVVFVLVRRFRLVLLMPLLQSFVRFLGNQMSPTFTSQPPSSMISDNEKARPLNELLELEQALEKLSSEHPEQEEHSFVDPSIHIVADEMVELSSGSSVLDQVEVLSFEGSVPVSVNEIEIDNVREHLPSSSIQVDIEDSVYESTADPLPAKARREVMELEVGVSGNPLQAATQDPSEIHSSIL